MCAADKFLSLEKRYDYDHKPVKTICKCKIVYVGLVIRQGLLLPSEFICLPCKVV